ncbi:MAG: large subunit ribosomal protein [Patescibacteria group bacterium]|nr:large subunit ribosomal protein [Patescibacteria group bacterium]
MASKIDKKTEYKIIEGHKLEMSQMFDDNAKVIPYTAISLNELTDEQKSFLKDLTSNTRIKLEGISKGKGFAGTMKRWGFHGGPATHGQKKKSRSPGSIGAQGDGHVLKGKKMAGHMGNVRISLQTYYISYDAEKNLAKVKGGIPGARNSKVKIYFAI